MVRSWAGLGRKGQGEPLSLDEAESMKNAFGTPGWGKGGISSVISAGNMERQE